MTKEAHREAVGSPVTPERDGRCMIKHAGARNEMIAVAWLLDNGFEVFRNVSQSGLIDIIAMKGERIYYFDVKAAKKSIVTGEASPSRKVLSRIQVELGIKRLNVFPDLTCEIVEDTIISNSEEAKQVPCKNCGKLFRLIGKKLMFCSRGCCSAEYNKRRRLLVAENAAPGAV